MEYEKKQQQKNEPEALCTLAVLMGSFTFLFTALGLACYLTADIPLSTRRVTAADAVVLYKAVRWAGVVIMLLPYAIDALLLIFLSFLWCCRTFSSSSYSNASSSSTSSSSSFSSSPPRPLLACSLRCDEAAAEWSRGRRQVEWEPPRYERVAELVRMLSMENTVKESRGGVVDVGGEVRAGGGGDGQDGRRSASSDGHVEVFIEE